MTLRHYAPWGGHVAQGNVLTACGTVISVTDSRGPATCPKCLAWMQDVDSMRMPEPQRVDFPDGTYGYRVARQIETGLVFTPPAQTNAATPLRLTDAIDPLAHAVQEIHSSLGDLLDVALKLRDPEQAQTLHTVATGLLERLTAIVELSGNKAKDLSHP